MLEHPGLAGSRAVLADPLLRRAAHGRRDGAHGRRAHLLALGARSGAHLNPAVTLTFFRLGRSSARDAVGYVGAQFAGGHSGIALAAVAAAPAGSPHRSVNYVATARAASGSRPRSRREAAISFVMMIVVLTSSNQRRVARFTGVVAGVLDRDCFITFEAPLSG